MEIKLGLQYEPESFPSTHENTRFDAVKFFNLQDMRYICSHLKSLKSLLTCRIDYLKKSCRLQYCNT